MEKESEEITMVSGETVITGIGQGFLLATPLQLAKFAATLANRGKAIAKLPFIIQNEQLESSDGQQS